MKKASLFKVVVILLSALSGVACDRHEAFEQGPMPKNHEKKGGVEIANTSTQTSTSDDTTPEAIDIADATTAVAPAAPGLVAEDSDVETEIQVDEVALAKWKAMEGTFRNNLRVNKSTLRVDNSFKVASAELHFWVNGEDLKLLPTFKDPILFDDETKLFYTVGTVEYLGEKTDIELYLKLSADKKTVAVSIILASTKTVLKTDLKRTPAHYLAAVGKPTAVAAEPN